MNNQAKKLIQIEALDNDLTTAEVQNLNLEEMTFIKGGLFTMKDFPIGGSPKDSPSGSKLWDRWGWISL